MRKTHRIIVLAYFDPAIKLEEGKLRYKNDIFTSASGLVFFFNLN